MKAKRVLAGLCLVVMMLGMVSTAFAATKPSATITSASKNQIVKRGKSVVFTYKLSSGSYTKKSGYYRSAFCSYIIKGSTNGTEYASYEKYFTGSGIKKVKWNTKKSYPVGKYVNLFGTFYRKSIYSTNWLVASSKKTNIYVTK